MDEQKTTTIHVVEADYYFDGWLAVAIYGITIAFFVALIWSTVKRLKKR